MAVWGGVVVRGECREGRIMREGGEDISTKSEKNLVDESVWTLQPIFPCRDEVLQDECLRDEQ